MESHLAEDSLWANALAARLRVLQANFADDDPATRQGYLVEEIERALKGCVPEKRKALLDALTVQFPAWQDSAPTAKTDAAAPAPPLTPELLLDRLLEAVPSLTPAQRADVVGKLKDAGLVAREQAGGELEIPAELRKRLGLSEDRAANPGHAVKLLAMLLDMVLTMDQLVWTLWKQLAAKSIIRREADLGKLSGEYLAGNNEVSTAQVSQGLERTRKMIAGLLGAVGRAGTTYAREQARLFDPSAIEADARSEKKWNESLEYACWRKYVQLRKEYGAEPVIEKGIQEAIAKATENLIMGRSTG
jgi:hypothetical protein